MKKLFLALALAAASIAPVYAETVPISGEVKKINIAQGKITLKHEAITNLEMDAMTMVFTVADAAMLTSVAVGDKVTFEADRVKGKLTVVTLEKAE